MSEKALFSTDLVLHDSEIIGRIDKNDFNYIKQIILKQGIAERHSDSGFYFHHKSFPKLSSISIATVLEIRRIKILMGNLIEKLDSKEKNRKAKENQLNKALSIQRSLDDLIIQMNDNEINNIAFENMKKVMLNAKQFITVTNADRVIDTYEDIIDKNNEISNCISQPVDSDTHIELVKEEAIQEMPIIKIPTKSVYSQNKRMPMPSSSLLNS